MNFISGIPVLFDWIMYTGGPQSAFANRTMVGRLSCVVSLAMAEIAAAMPTSGVSYWCDVFSGKRTLTCRQYVVVDH